MFLILLIEFLCIIFRSFSRFSSYIKKVIDDNNQAEGTAILLKVRTLKVLAMLSYLQMFSSTAVGRTTASLSSFSVN